MEKILSYIREWERRRIPGAENYMFYALFLLLTELLLDNPLWRDRVSGDIILFLILYGTMIFLLFAVFPPVFAVRRRGLQDRVRIYAFTGAAIFLAIRFLLSIFLRRLAESPYDHSPSGILQNVLLVGLRLFFREAVRVYALAVILRRPKHRKALIFLLTFLLAATEINVLKFLKLPEQKEIFIEITEHVLPSFAQGFLLTILSLYGGLSASLFYAASIALFQRLFPVLPGLPWLAESAIGLCFPVFYAFYIKEEQEGEEYGRMAARRNGFSPSYIISLVLLTAFYWFSVGVFPIYPSTILTGSMEPGIKPGDIVLIRRFHSEAELDQLREGDIINFRREGIVITHRILRIQKDAAGNLSFITKGDNNVSEDQEAVLPNDINGPVVKVLPKLGSYQLLLHSGENRAEGVVETGRSEEEKRGSKEAEETDSEQSEGRIAGGENRGDE